MHASSFDLTDPLRGVAPRDGYAVPIGMPLVEVEPVRNGRILMRNGEWCLRADWELEVVQPHDVLMWFDPQTLPQNREAVRYLLQAAALVVSAISSNPGVYAAFAAALTAYNILVPPKPPKAEEQPGSIYSASLDGNAARLDEPIWKVCGRVKIAPPFAAMPYGEFLPSDPANPTHDCDQYYYGLFAVSEGNLDLEKAFLGKTSITHFGDVLVHQLLAPGVQPSTVKANIVTASEVTGLEVKGRNDDGDFALYVGPFAVCRPGDKVVKVSVDMMAGQGLGTATGGSRTAIWQVEAREINDYGSPVGQWVVLGTESRTDKTNTAQRWTVTYTLSAPIRCEVRVVRTDVESTDPQYRDGLSWIGLRGELLKQAPLNANVTHYEVVMRASKQLSNESQHDFSMIVRGKCRTLNASLAWQAESFNRNPAWWLLDLLTSSTWGLGLPDDRVDLQSFYDLAQTCDQRQDHFDFAFTEAMDGWEAAQLIAQSCRARVFRRGVVFTVARDELVDLPVAAITSRNSQPGSMKLSSKLPSLEQPDGLVVQYQSNVTWDLATIECPCPGFSVANSDDPRYDPDLPPMSKPIWIRIDGVTGYYHALREGTYQAASEAYRRDTTESQIELEGMLLAVMDPVRWQPRMIGYGQTGDVAFWSETTKVMGLTEPPDWSAAPLYLTLRRDDNSLTEPVLVTPGPTANDVVLPSVPDFDIVVSDGTRERPLFLLGPDVSSDEIVKVAKIEDGGRTDDGVQLYTITAMVDDDRVHLADNAYLPGPGEIQDPIDDGLDIDDDSGGGIAVLPRLNDHYYRETSAEGLAYRVRFFFEPSGQLHYDVYDTAISAVIVPDTNFPNEWLTAPQDPAHYADYEIYADLQYAEDPGKTIGTFNTWLPMTSQRVFGVDLTGGASTYQSRTIFIVRIRRAGQSVVLDSGKITIYLGDFAGGGG